MVTLPKGTLVHFEGMPFRLLDDVKADGLEVNYNFALSQPETSCVKFNHAASAGDANLIVLC